MRSCCSPVFSDDDFVRPYTAPTELVRSDKGRSAPDKDRDGIPDHCDKCPDAPEPWDGCLVGDGCPGSHCQACLANKPYKTQKVAIRFGTGRDVLTSSTRQRLDNVAQQMTTPEAMRGWS
jgi:outer membrane protein OmpA-like peptidoglycan-associated protein